MTIPYNYPPFKTDANGNILVSLTGGGSASFSSVTITGAALMQKAYTANTSTAYTLDPANGAEFDLSLTGNATITLASPTSGITWVIYGKVTQDGVGGRTLAWANVTWIPGTAPTMPTTASTGTIYVVFFTDGITVFGNYNPASTGSGSVVLSASPTLTGTANFANITTAPTDSHTATTAFATTLTLGTAIQNTTGYDLTVCIGFAVSTATTATVILGVGPTSTPTTDTVIPSFTSVGCALSITAHVPNNYYLLVNKTGTFTNTNNIVATPL